MSVIFSRGRGSNKISRRPYFFDSKDLKNVPLVEIPGTAQEYLASVVAERQTISKISLNNIDYEQYKQNQTVFYDQEPLPIVPDRFKLDRRVAKIIVSDFESVKKYCHRMRIQEFQRIKLILIENNAGVYWWMYFITRHTPLLSIVLGFTAARVDEALENLLLIIKQTKHGETIQNRAGRWIYAMLACTREPLHSDTISIMREISKQCWKIRSELDDNNEERVARPLNLIILLVGRYFKQLDLADEVLDNYWRCV